MSDESASDTAEETPAASAEEDEASEPTSAEQAPDTQAEPEASDTDEGDADAEEAPAEDAIEESDVIRVDYTARSVETDQLVDTTDPEVAEEEGVDPEQQSIEPRVVPIGAGHLFPSVEDDFIGKEVGDTGSVTVPPTEAFGEYDPDDVRTVSADRIPEDDRYPGAMVEIDGESGHVERIIGGRARVDFNHPLAGEEIEYDYEILELVDDPIAQAKGMLEPIVDADLDLWIQTDEVEEEVPVEPDEDADEEAEPEFETETVEKRTLYIESVPQMAMNQQWLFSKRQIAQELIDRLDLDRVVIQETIEGAAGPLGGLGGGGDIEDVASAIEDVDIDEEGDIEAELEEELDEEIEATADDEA